MSEVRINLDQIQELAETIEAASQIVERQLDEVANEITVTGGYENFRGNRAAALRLNWQQAHSQIEDWPFELKGLAEMLKSAAAAFRDADREESIKQTDPKETVQRVLNPSQTYTINPGDTLTSIAQRHGTSIEALVRANNISNPDLIYAGDTLIIPGDNSNVPGGYPAPDPKITDGPYAPGELTSIIDAFNVESNAKYAARGENTYCNLFASDVVQRLGAPLPLYVTNSQGEITDWLGATNMKEWLNGNLTSPGDYQQGTEVGWQRVDAATAANYANNGYVSVAAGYGHIAVVRPGTPTGAGKYDVMIAQAGGRNFNSGRVIDGWGSHADEVDFYVFKPS